MADKLLKSIKFPTLPDRYVIGDSTLTEEGAAADAKAVGDALAKKADTKGTYGDLIVGGAEQLMSDEYESDSEPYLFRTTGGSADVGNREYLDKIVGGTVGWNQLLPNRAPKTETINGVTFTVNADGTITINGTATALARFDIGTRIDYFKNHVYAVIGVLHGGSSSTYRAVIMGYNYNDGIEKFDIDDYYTPRLEVAQGATVNNLKCLPMLFDLTAMFGQTIADYIYSLEQSQAGAGVAWFRRYFPEDYYPYDAGTLRSVEGVSAHETVGFNQWDEEWESGWISSTTGNKAIDATAIRSKNHIPVLPNTTYYAKTDGYNGANRIAYYDENKQFLDSSVGGRWAVLPNGMFTTPKEAHYMMFCIANTTTYNHDICINISDPSRNGEYEPYVKHTYPLDSSLTLRGVPKLVDGKLAFDGDVYPSSGEVQRRYGLRAYQSGDESLADAITDGTNTVYKLATPTTETAEGYEQYQICDPSGTEEFVTTGIVPVGHETRYPHDLKKKIETAPDSPSADGTYLMKRSGGKNTYMALPSTPSANGSYVLTVTVSGGSASYSWTSKE